MGEVSKSAKGTVQGNTVVLHKVKIAFQLYPGTAGTDAQRGIMGVPYSVEITDASGIGLVTDGKKTAADGSIELLMQVGDSAIVTIFDTDYHITLRDTIPTIKSPVGIQRRLSLLGYYLEEIVGVEDEKTVIGLLNFQADSNLNANAKLHEKISESTINRLKKDIGE